MAGGVFEAKLRTSVRLAYLSRGLINYLFNVTQIYSGPSGIFQKHVDTPRSKTQIGSLVVCLPSSFDGGNLLVRHNGQEVDFDWQARSANTIQWAAFYCDCEHEIRTISRGERITLTYNLYIVESPEIPNSSGSIDPTVYPLYQELRDILATPAFLKTGGVLGIFCSHAYAHTSRNVSELLPRSLKGSDLVLYTVLKSLGINANILPVLRDDEYESYENSDGSSDEDGYYVTVRRGVRYYVRRGVRYKLHVGDKLIPCFAARNNKEHYLSKVIKESWKEREFEKPVTWLCKPTHAESAMSYISYGNEAADELEAYSFAAIMAVIPPWTGRLSKTSKAEGQN